MAACPLCSSRKGKRACPAKKATICSICCGEKRVVEIDCPADCIYLGRGARNEVRREAVDYYQHQDPGKTMRWLKTMDALGFLVEAIEDMIAAAPLRSLEDSGLLAALESARRTFDAEAKGVIYEDLPPLPSLQALTQDLVAGVRSLRQRFEEAIRTAGPEGAGSLPSWGPAEAAECLAVLAERCEFHVRRKDSVGSFVEHLRRVHPRPAGGEESSEAPRIILA